jgi:thymidylate synthase (FAD)
MRDPNLKQGSKTEIVPLNSHICKVYTQAVELCLETYKSLLEANVAPEMARAVLPQSMYTEFIETGSLAAYTRLCNLRLDTHAQKEVQEFAQAVCDLIEPHFPVSWKALMN